MEEIILSSPRYIVGITISDKNVETANPPITAIAIGCCNSAPSFNAKASGTSPKMVVSAVIIIGLRRLLLEAITAS